MSQVIKLKRGGIEAIGTTTPTTLKGELILATGSFSGGVLGTSLFAAEADNTLRLTHGRIDSVSDGSALATAIGNNDSFTGLLIHSASDNKLYRYSGTAFVELPIAAGSFEGILPVTNGGTGTSSLSDIVGNSEIIVQNGTDSIIAGADGPVVLTLGGGVVTGSAQIDGANILNNTVEFGGVSVALGSSDSTPAFDLQDATGYPGDSNLVTLGTVTTGDVSAILPAGTVSGSVQITISDTTGYTTFSSSIATDITTNAGNISTNAGNISTNAGNISTNAGNISTNAGDISTNTNNIATLTAATSSYLQSADVSSYLISASVIGTANEIEVSANGAQGIQIGLPNDVTITGNLTVAGTTTTVNSDTVTIADNIIQLNSDSDGVADAGIEVLTGAATASLLYDVANTWWETNDGSTSRRIVSFTDDAGSADVSFVYTDTNGYLAHIDVETPADTAGTFLQWNGSTMEASHIIDGGTF